MELENHPIYQDLTPDELQLDQIYLDPNNPRFITMDWNEIPEEKIDNAKVQEDVQYKLEKSYGIDSLTNNMEINGYLPIDRVIVKEFATNKYYVLEGNRRIAAAKNLKRKMEGDNNNSILKSLEKIPVLIYTGDNSEASWIFQGLRHIIGVKEWSAYNKAKLLVKLIEEEDMTLTEVGNKFGVSSFGAGQWARGYYALNQAKYESDFATEIDEKVYPFFQEMFNRSNAALREWLGWDDAQKKFQDELKFNEFLGWLYPKEFDEYDEAQDLSDTKGDWSMRKIRTAQSLRDLSYLIRYNTKEFENFRNNQELEKSYNRALQAEYEEEAKKTSNPIENTMDAIESCIKSLESVPFTVFSNQELYGRMVNNLDLLTEKINAIRNFKNE